MIYRLIGAVLILAGCGGFGLSLASEYRRRERLLGEVHRALKLMYWELEFRLTPLPELCSMTGKQTGGTVGKILCRISKKLKQQAFPDVSGCIESVLTQFEDLPRVVRMLLRQLGGSLGRYDLPGQLEGLEELTEVCKREEARLREGKDQRIRSYRTLGLCAGAAMAILLV